MRRGGAARSPEEELGGAALNREVNTFFFVTKNQRFLRFQRFQRRDINYHRGPNLVVPAPVLEISDELY